MGSIMQADALAAKLWVNEEIHKAIIASNNGVQRFWWCVAGGTARAARRRTLTLGTIAEVELEELEYKRRIQCV